MRAWTGHEAGPGLGPGPRDIKNSKVRRKMSCGARPIPEVTFQIDENIQLRNFSGNKHENKVPENARKLLYLRENLRILRFKY